MSDTTTALPAGLATLEKRTDIIKALMNDKFDPKVFAWQGFKHGLGWIVQEYLPGEQLSLHFSDLQTDKKAVVLDQVAEIFKMIQSFQHGVEGFGGLGFDGKGSVVAGRSSLWSVGPFSTHAGMYRAIFAKQLDLVQVTPLLDGWKGTGLQERLQKLNASGGFANLLAYTANIQPTLVHGDFGAENILINPDTLQITGLPDFVFSHIASPADEYFYSFPSFSGLVPGPFEDEDLQLLRRYQTEGFPSTPSAQEATSKSVDWTVARLWQAALEKHNVASPKDIENITQLADIYWFLLDVCPPFFNLPRWLARKTDEQKLAAKKVIGENLDRYLRRWDY
ncbi:hypothetical protein D6D06_09181 [Aureobasidium pullulans]|nr:hypothetical protein D6D06_09181 [Aureobasidium pullulans]